MLLNKATKDLVGILGLKGFTLQNHVGANLVQDTSCFMLFVLLTMHLSNSFMVLVRDISDT